MLFILKRPQHKATERGWADTTDVMWIQGPRGGVPPHSKGVPRFRSKHFSVAGKYCTANEMRPGGVIVEGNTVA